MGEFLDNNLCTERSLQSWMDSSLVRLVPVLVCSCGREKPAHVEKGDLSVSFSLNRSGFSTSTCRHLSVDRSFRAKSERKTKGFLRLPPACARAKERKFPARRFDQIQNERIFADNELAIIIYSVYLLRKVGKKLGSVHAGISFKLATARMNLVNWFSFGRS